MTGSVAHVSTADTWRGGERQLLFLAEGLKARGVDTFVVAPPGAPLLERARAAGVDAVAWKGRHWDPVSRWSLARLLRRRGAAVVHAHDSHAASLLAGRRGFARVATRRVDFAIRHGAKYARGFDRVVAISGAIADCCRAAGVPEEKLRHVPSGVRLDWTEAALANRDKTRAALAAGFGPGKEKPLFVLAVGSLVPHKDHRTLLAAWPAVLAKLPQATLLLAGDGELEDDLKALAQELGVDEDVHFLGFRDDVPDLLAAADLFVMPSAQEGLGTSALDAMAAGRAVVLTRAGGLAELVEDGKTGRLAEPGDAESLARAMLALLEDRTQREHVGRMARAAARKYSVDAMVEGNIAVYRELSHFQE